MRSLLRLCPGLLALAAWGADCRFTLADQSDWDGKLGFYLDLENTSSGTAPCALSSLRIALGVAGGGTWRFVVQNPGWQLNRDYTARAVIMPDRSEFWLDQQLLGRINGPFAPRPNLAVWAGVVPGWANGATAYQIVQTSVRIEAGGGSHAALDLAAAQSAPPVVALSGGGVGGSTSWSAPAGETWTVTATFRLQEPFRAPDYYPIIDRYGQAVAADWPSKIRSDADLAEATTQEQARLNEWGTPAGFDAYGGVLNAPWKEQGNGFYRIVRREGMFWLVTPLGNPCFYIGLNTAPALTWDRTPVTGREAMFAELPRNGAYAEAWGRDSWGQNDGTVDVSFATFNMIRKYGDGWKAAQLDLFRRRLKSWGFSGIAKWGDAVEATPMMPVLGRWNVPSLSRRPDVFDPAVLAAFRAELARQIEPRRNDPLVVGWSLGNEYDEIVTAAETAAILGLGGAVPAKRALVDEALRGYNGDVAALASAWRVQAASAAALYSATNAQPPAPDLERLRRFFARAYYEFVYRTVKELDPNHLYFGFWITPGWWENEEDWRLIAPYCDAIGYDRYSDSLVEPYLDRLIRETDKPILLGEFSFPADYGFRRGFRRYFVWASDDAESGAKVARTVDAAARNPWVLGVGWFQYRDEPVSGRGPGQGPEVFYGENFAFGLVDIGDRPKYDLVAPLRAANLAAAATRLGFRRPAVNTGGVVNAASFAPGAAVAPGSLISVFGTGLAGATLRMGNFEAPILYSSENQINAQAPWELAGLGSAPLAVSNGNVVEVPLAVYSPGIFAALPGRVRRGEYLTIYCNGLGPVSNQPGTGIRGPLSPLPETATTPVVTIGDTSAPVTYSGMAPTWIGLYQVNTRIPDNAPLGAGVPVRVSIGGLTSNSVNVAIEP